MTTPKYPTDLTDAQWDKLLPGCRKPHLPFSRLVGTVSNSVYAVRLGNR